MDDKENISRHRKKDQVYKFVFFFILIFFIILFFSLGFWQIKRLHWKTDLLERINNRIILPINPVPPKKMWNKITNKDYEYLPVYLKGHFLNDKKIFINTITCYGSGYWLFIPLETKNKYSVLINLGFLLMDNKEEIQKSKIQINGEKIVKGLLRIGESNGIFPRNNSPKENVWYTRELTSIAKTYNIPNVAPYFIDSYDTFNIKKILKNNIKTIHISNNHLIYSITWFTMGIFLFFAFFLRELSFKKR